LKPAQENSSQDPISKIPNTNQVPVAHAYNLSYSGGRDKVDHGSKPARATTSGDPILKKPITAKELM
jgi:hypothetical protein